MVLVVADPRACGPGDLGLGQETQVPGHGHGHVGQRQRDRAARPGALPAPFRGEQPDRPPERPGQRGDEDNGQYRNDHRKTVVDGEMSHDGCLRSRIDRGLYSRTR